MVSLVARAGVPRSYLYKFEDGDVTRPGLQVLDAVAKAYGVTLADLMRYGAPKSGSKPAGSAGEPKPDKLGLPAGLRRFIAQWEREHPGKRMPADTVVSLAGIQFRGKRPKHLKDWRVIHDTIANCLR